MPTPMHPVTSSMISYIGWSNGDLYVTFHNKTKYKYSNVPEYILSKLLNSSSVGKTFNLEVKGKYPSEEL